jgi:hypothetical protein
VLGEQIAQSEEPVQISVLADAYKLPLDFVASLLKEAVAKKRIIGCVYQ